MSMVKRIFLFLAVNFLVILMISFIMQILNVKPFLTGYGLNYTSLLIFCSIWGFVGAFISLGLSRIIAKKLMGVQVIDPTKAEGEHLKLCQLIEKLAQRAHLKAIPEVGIYSSNEINAFATGPTQNRSLVAVSSGLLNRLNLKEIEAILAHEITHISNGDMVTMTLMQGVVNAFVMFLARVVAFAVSGMNRSKNSSQSNYFSYYIFVYLFEIVFMILGSMVTAAFSRYREFRADKGGAELSSKEAMIDALKSLKAMQEIKDPKERAPSMQALKISSTNKKGLIQLFATHPPLNLRIERLQQMR
jgi:heat shock protein HtpX